MDKVVKEFEKRHRAVTEKHRKLAEGYVTSLNRNGTIEHKPIRRVPFFKLRTLLIAGACFLAFKGLLLTSLGVEGYEGHIGRLASGGIVEKAGAWVMSPDRASLWIAETVQRILA
ncbi:hypothetical protein Q4543_03215 [Salipiger sp. 1_MG-2023]|uniref:hypothetical protein n=1 Tax=Salipiger sp. 1_MG-2023 TaxID=3062665 RepID=UPI0026E1378A|nr:hypothetical protein [Salipiger sp. 1_MG-2023]MDO6584518.1 hypothetical protein [Salipiger sp. 1_MG-2023]